MRSIKTYEILSSGNSYHVDAEVAIVENGALLFIDNKEVLAMFNNWDHFRVIKVIEKTEKLEEPVSNDSNT